ncbi:MAG: thioredoxin domain-containing protein [Anaerolineae bacterium]|nr:thioredoxin domain-containing protein [Anaerolineae bacterium]
MPNRLAQESSPYLLQHAHNPVDWYPWGEEALGRAKTEDKPIFLSIGYSACHWCHVMAYESFENEQIATIMNEYFVNIKVDREERPDLDSIYMDAVVAMTGQGGWPMSVFLTPDGKPFYGGTYFPPTPHHGMPGFEQVLRSIARAYHQQKDDVLANADTLVNHINALIPLQIGTSLDPAVSELAVQTLTRNFDWTNGGFGGAPKFPQPMTYDFLLRAYYRNRKPETLEMVELTLYKMAHGGMYDQLGGGFHRYAVDNRWLVPHFEKMLYDNALLARLYLHAYQLTGKSLYRRITEETLDYVIREMTHPDGGFYSTQDADSEGEEGKFFIWTPEEIRAILGNTEGQIFCQVYDVKPGGNFEGKSILNIPVPLDQLAKDLKINLADLNDTLHRSRVKLFTEREKRAKPGRDEKIIAGWNGLMLAAFAEAGRVFNRSDYIDMAIRNAKFVLSVMTKNGRLFRTWKETPGKVKLRGYLEDYAFYADGLLALYQTTFDPHWFQQARHLMEVVLDHFRDEQGGFFDTADDHEQLITRPKNLQDNTIPSGNSMAVRVLLQLAAYTGQTEYTTPAFEALAGLSGPMSQHPGAFAHWLGALEFALAPPKEIAIIGQSNSEEAPKMLNLLFESYRPDQVVAMTNENETAGHPELVLERPAINGQTTVYVCQNFTCRQPVTTVEELEALVQLGVNTS